MEQAVELLSDLNEEQRLAVTHGEGPVLIVAGAGTGKTTVITRRIAWLLLEKKYKPDEVLAVTFTDKAAGEMEERVERLLPYGYVDLWVLTFHAFCERVLRDHAMDIGLDPNFKLLDPTDAWMLMRKHFDRFSLNYFRPLGNPTKFLQTLIDHFSRAKDEDISPEEYLNYAEQLKLNRDAVDTSPPLRKDGKGESEEEPDAERIAEIASAYHVYQQVMMENNALDFGDLITLALKCFRERPAILSAIQKQFKAILVDEFQDTNFAQYALIKLLASDDSNITVVADDDQSIYAFRSASISNILEFKKDFPSSAEIVLTKNYRSPQNILDLAYQFIQLNNPNRLEAQLQRREQLPKTKEEEKEATHLAEEIALKGKLLDKPISKRLESQIKGEGRIAHLHYPKLDDEVRGVADEMIKIKNETSGSWNDFAILVRANDYADPFIHRLQLLGVPYQFVASRGLFSKPGVVNLLAVFHAIDQAHDSRSMYRFITMPVFELSPEDVMVLTYAAERKGLSLFQAMDQAHALRDLSEVGRQTILRQVALIRHLAEAGRRTKPSAILLDFLQQSGMFEQLSAKKEDPMMWDELNVYNQFLTLIQDMERRQGDLTVHALLEEIDLKLEAGERGALQPSFSEGPEAVKVLTIHAAKGLEFPHVFIVNMVDKRFPSVSRSRGIDLPQALVKEILPEGDIHLQEERRLFYVALTRSRQTLILASSEDVGGSRRKKVSRFLLESGLVKASYPEIKSPPPPHSHLEAPAAASVKTAVVLPKTTTFSFTQLKSFETCPWQYYLGFVMRVPKPGNYSMSFGKTMHSTLQKFFEQRKSRSQASQGELFGGAVGVEQSAELSLDELLRIYEHSWIDDWYPNASLKKEYYDKGRNMLKEFFELHQEKWPEPKYLEKGFRVHVGDYMIKGVIDRIDPIVDDRGEGVEILDYKTGSVPASEKGIDWDQLMLYAFGVQEALGERPSRLTFYYLFEQKTFHRTPDEGRIAAVKDKALATIQKILAGGFSATPGHHCRFCDYRSICEFRDR